jgi:hypothetical protein
LLGGSAVSDDAVGERIVSVELVRPSQAFAILNAPEVAGKLIEQQIALASMGGNVGRVILRVKDPDDPASILPSG